MRTFTGLRAARALAVTAGLLLAAGSASAQAPDQVLASTDRPGSILIFPKVINDGTRDTLITISNSFNLTGQLQCYYVDGSLDGAGEPRWQITDFELTLTAQQPTHWVASEGRFPDPTDNSPQGGMVQNNAGLDPGAVPPVIEGFTGELRCVQVGPDGAPMAGDFFKGSAVVLDNDGGDVARYNAIAVESSANNDQNQTLEFSQLRPGLPGADTPGEYAACPGGAHLHFQPSEAPDIVIADLAGTPAPVRSGVTFVPCGADYENAVPSSVTIQFTMRNEFEEARSGSTSVTCWQNVPISSIGEATDPSTFGSLFGYARLRPVGTCSESGDSCVDDSSCPDAENCVIAESFFAVQEVVRSGPAGTGVAINNLQFLENASRDEPVMRVRGDF